MTMLEDAPEWAKQFRVSFESGAAGQFVVHGNVNDRMASASELVNIEYYIRDVLLHDFDVVFTYDLGSGLQVIRGGEKLADWVPSALRTLPQSPLEAFRFISKYLFYVANVSVIHSRVPLRVGVIIRSAAQILPAAGDGFEHGAITAVVREWGANDPFAQLPFASLLLTENLTDLEPLIACAPHVAAIQIPLPSALELESALVCLQRRYPDTMPNSVDLKALGATVMGVSIRTLEQLTKIRAYRSEVLQSRELTAFKKEMVEHDAAGLVEFMQSSRTLEHYHGQEALKRWLRQDIELWRSNDLKALPMGYLLCGPVGTGKTYLVECLAGEVGVPIVKLRNFRDKWIGASEGNLEKLFRLARALGRCIIFIDEADQALGRRDSGISDGGLSGRLYSMLAQEMADSTNRGRVMWVLASSRPDLIEVDLKRPGRMDLRIPILPTSSQAEGAALLSALSDRYELGVTHEDLSALSSIPLLMTPGAAEALIVKAYRMVRTEGMRAHLAIERCLASYQNPVPQDILETQMRLAIREATDLSFVPEALKHLAADVAV
ncbi:MAG TPA: AAA family ATPase [Steroidobacteraceae bacterium]|nr:AAA family ATPase [Steroidobacteraceae bacterium]